MAEQIDRETWTELDCVGSNLDMSIDHDIAARLMAEPQTFAQYAAWNWCGYVWHDERGWHMEVWRYRSLATVVHGDTIEDVRAEAIDWGGAE